MRRREEREIKGPEDQGGFGSTGLKLYIYKRDVSVPISADMHLTDINYCSFSLVAVRNDNFSSADYFAIAKFHTILTPKYKPELLSYFKLQNGYLGGLR